MKNFACAEFSQLIQKNSNDLSDINLGSILQNEEKSKLWACQFLRRLSGEITEENMERTLRIKFIELRDKIKENFANNKEYSETILVMFHNPEEDKVIWEINNKTRDTSITSLLEHIEKNFKNIFKSDNVLAYAQKFLKQDVKNRLDDAPEKHIYCNTAILATKIFENLRDNSAYEKIKKSQEEKEWSYPVIIGGALAVVTVVGSLYWFRDNIKELFYKAPSLRQKFFRQMGVY
ncbi:MAG: hypothetical protein H0T62_11160 [Parachlamydiaceae bacterium]|nr:hypothetical protein [Parachlamydiaceae bacterium]